MFSLLKALNVFNSTGEVMTQDAAHWHHKDTLAEHDKKYHGGMFRGGECLFRKRGDDTDELGVWQPGALGSAASGTKVRAVDLVDKALDGVTALGMANRVSEVIENSIVDIRGTDAELEAVRESALDFFSRYARSVIPLSTGARMCFIPPRKMSERNKGDTTNAWAEYAIHAVTNDCKDSEGKHYRRYAKKKVLEVLPRIAEVVGNDLCEYLKARDAVVFYKRLDKGVAKVLARPIEGGNISADLSEVTGVYTSKTRLPVNLDTLEKTAEAGGVKGSLSLTSTKNIVAHSEKDGQAQYEKNAEDSAITAYLEHCALDESVADLQKHDTKYHGGHYDGKSSCKYRERLAAGDNVDALDPENVEGERVHGKDSKRRAMYRSILSKKRSDIEGDAQDALLDEIEKFETPKEQKLALHWFVRGTIKLPEDAYKVTDAIGYADRAKKDPFAYGSPMSLIDDLHEFKPKAKPIDPEKVPELSDKQVLPMGVTTYLVQDDQAGQRAMRKILDTHWGEDANPWCLLARSGEDEQDENFNERFRSWWNGLSVKGQKDILASEGMDKDDFAYWDDDDIDGIPLDSIDSQAVENYYLKNVDVSFRADDASLRDAWHYWKHYNGLPKRVAFKDGKLLAFMATEKIAPFDEDGIIDYWSVDAMSELYPDQYSEYEDWLETEEGREEDANFIEWLEHEYPELLEDDAIAKHTKEQWWDRKDAPHEGIPIGYRQVEGDEFGRWGWYEIRDGEAKHIGGFRKGDPGAPGTIEWYYDGGLLSYTDGHMTYEWDEDGALEEVRTNNGMTKYRFNSDGSFKEFVDSYGRTENPSPSIQEKILDYAKKLREEHSVHKTPRETDS